MVALFPASSPPAAPHAVSSGAAVDWRGATGALWATRNPRTVEALDRMYTKQWGITRSALARQYLERVPRSSAILEVGCSHGTQLEVLRGIGFSQLTGVDVCRPALLECTSPCAVADGMRLPFRSTSFDLVMTSGTLMHVPLDQRVAFCRELLRVSRRWIWGWEIWSEEPTMWNFGGLIPNAWSVPEPCSYRMADPRVQVLRAERFEANRLWHVMFLLERPAE